MKFEPDAYDAVLFDLDGTLYHEERPIPAAVELVHRLRGRGTKVGFLTNSTSSPARIAERLARMDVRVDPQFVYTAGAAAVDLAMNQFGPAARIFNCSTDGVAEMLSDAGAVAVNEPDAPCDAIIVGAPYNGFATEERRRTALYLLRGGAALVGICADRIFPSARGMEFGAGALCAMLAYAANVTPVFAGKPEPEFFTNLCKRLRADPARCVLLGDNLESDVAGARRVGMDTILVLTGVATREDLLNIPDDKRPGRVVQDCFELM